MHLFSQHQTRLLVYVRSLVNNHHVADEILQETSYVLWREFHHFQRGTNFMAWSSQVAYNQMLAWRKRQQRDRLVFSDDFLAAINREFSNDSEKYEQRFQQLSQCIERLPSHHRELIRLRYTLGEGVEMIAEHVQKTVTSVYRMLSRIRQTLHDCVNIQIEQRQHD